MLHFFINQFYKHKGTYSLKKRITFFIAAICFFALSGCSNLFPKPSALYMTAYMHQNPLEKKTPLENNIYIESITGAGHASTQMMMEHLPDMQFNQAVKDSFKNAHLLSKDPNARYRMTVNMVSFEIPTFVIVDITLTTSIAYKITDTLSKKVIWDQVIRTTTTRVSNETVPATEVIVKENIKRAINQIININFNDESKNNNETSLKKENAHGV